MGLLVWSHFFPGQLSAIALSSRLKHNEAVAQAPEQYARRRRCDQAAVINDKGA